MRIRISRGRKKLRLGLALAGTVAVVLLTGAGIFIHYWIVYGRMIDQRLSGHLQQTTARIYAAPMEIWTGEPLTAQSLASHLQRAGYTQLDVLGAVGRYQVRRDDIEIRPSSRSYTGSANAIEVRFRGRDVETIRSLTTGAVMDSAQVDPELLTNLFDSSRVVRRPVRFDEIPVILRNAVLSVEDKRFFEHPGVDFIRIAGAAWADLRHDAREQGASTISMQLARTLFFSTRRTWRRKIEETFVAIELEHRFSKRQIFDLYANEIYLGNRGSFVIRGFGEASLAYFNKDVRDLTLSEAAFLAGIIHAPNRYSTADQRPKRAAEARDRALSAMVANHVISPEQAAEARQQPLHLVSGALEGATAPYFVDMVKDHLLNHFSQADLLSEGFRVYTTLDPDLQRAAVKAVRDGMKNVDKHLARRYARWRKLGKPVPKAQVALVALDPRTGEIKALLGGRDYGQSQLNRVLAHRQPGSSFKPFVYAAALEGDVDGVQPILTPESTVLDEPTTFDFNNEEYTPNNYGAEFHGTVTLRDALTYSLNVATIKVAQMVGYQRVVDMLRQFGLPSTIQATPSMAIGSYDMTPLQVAAGYTIFADDGTRAEPMFIRKVVNSDGNTLEQNAPQTRQALDPRVAYLVTNMMEDVINRGTGETVRAMGFTAPAAGKTGTSRDGWFAGYTSNLLCIVWVGFDDNRDLGLPGSTSAAPIWTEFMKRAISFPAYNNVQPFAMPDGVTQVEIDPETMELATPACPATREEVYIRGTEPTQFCTLHGGYRAGAPPASWLSRIFGGGKKPKAPEPETVSPAPGRNPAVAGATGSAPPPASGSATEENSSEGAAKSKKSIFRRIFGIFGGSHKDDQ